MAPAQAPVAKGGDIRAANNAVVSHAMVLTKDVPKVIAAAIRAVAREAVTAVMAVARAAEATAAPVREAPATVVIVKEDTGKAASETVARAKAASETAVVIATVDTGKVASATVEAVKAAIGTAVIGTAAIGKAVSATEVTAKVDLDTAITARATVTGSRVSVNFPPVKAAHAITVTGIRVVGRLPPDEIMPLVKGGRGVSRALVRTRRGEKDTVVRTARVGKGGVPAVVGVDVQAQVRRAVRVVRQGGVVGPVARGRAAVAEAMSVVRIAADASVSCPSSSSKPR